MGSATCTRCGQKIHTKCFVCRSIFPEKGMDGVLSYMLKASIETKDNFDWLSIKFFMGDGTERKNIAWGFNQLKKALNLMGSDPNYPTIEEYWCDHHYEWDEGSGPSIDCGHTGRKVVNG